MKPSATEWVSKAEGDFATAGRELRARRSPNYDNGPSRRAGQGGLKICKALIGGRVARYGFSWAYRDHENVTGLLQGPKGPCGTQQAGIQEG